MDEKKLRIFKGLRLTEREAKDLAIYWKAAGNSVGIITEKGSLRTSNRFWDRPIAVDNFTALRKALEACPVSWIIVCDNQLVVDFDHLEYNRGWLKKMFKNRGLGVRYQKGVGLKLYQKKESYGKTWYQELEWTLKGVTIKSLNLRKKETVSLTPNPENPDDANWAELYFAS